MGTQKPVWLSPEGHQPHHTQKAIMAIQKCLHLRQESVPIGPSSANEMDEMVKSLAATQRPHLPTRL